MNRDRLPVVVVGGGLAGPTAAAYLARAGWPVTLYDITRPGWRDAVVKRVYLPDIAAVGALPLAERGGFEGRPGVEVEGVSSLYLAGDWTGRARWCWFGRTDTSPPWPTRGPATSVPRRSDRRDGSGASRGRTDLSTAAGLR